MVDTYVMSTAGNPAQLRCPACGHVWIEADAVRIAQAWFSAGAWAGRMKMESLQDG